MINKKLSRSGSGCILALRKRASGTTDKCWKWHHAGENARQTNMTTARHTTVGMLWRHRDIPAYPAGTCKQVLPKWYFFLLPYLINANFSIIFLRYCQYSCFFSAIELLDSITRPFPVNGIWYSMAQWPWSSLPQSVAHGLMVVSRHCLRLWWHLVKKIWRTPD